MTTATATLRGALDRHDRDVPDKSVGDHDAPRSATGSLPEDDDRQLIARVAAKDQQAFTLLYQRYAPPPISGFQFRRFLRDIITPLFPDGLTVLSGLGQFKDPSGRIVREGARLVILIYPLDAAGASENIDAIRETYKEEFEQQSVLRTDSIDCVSF